MPRKTLPVTGCPEPFLLTEKTLARLAKDYPKVDVEQTLDRFVRKADAIGWMYRNWQSAFLNYCDNGEKYGGVVYKQGRAQDPRWIPILSEAAPYGFREPHPHETPDTYRTQFNWWKDEQKKSRAPVIQFGEALRGFGK
jgi:hypothetical protein